MYALELLLQGSHYHCSCVLIRSKHAWLARALRREVLLPLLEASKLGPALHELRYRLQPGADLELRGRGDVVRLLGSRSLDEPAAGALEALVRAVGYANIAQCLAARHPLVLLYSVAEGCLGGGAYCVVEPRVEVEDHSLCRRLEGERLLPYRVFDVLVSRGRRLAFVEVKYSRGGKGELPAGTMLAYLASFLEKLTATVALVGEALQRAGYGQSYELVVVLGPGTGARESVMKHARAVASSIGALVSVNVSVKHVSYAELVASAEKELKRLPESCSAPVAQRAAV